MNTIESIENRRSIRDFKKDDISKETVEDILNCGRLAPSAKNRQPWYFVVTKGRTKNKIADMMIKYTINNDDTLERKKLGCASSVNPTANVIKQAPIMDEEIYYASDPPTLGLKASLRSLFYDFHSLMNDEIIFLHLPKYIVDKNFELSEEEYAELDNLAKLMLDPDKNFEELLQIWNNEPKFRIMTGGLN